LIDASMLGNRYGQGTGYGQTVHHHPAGGSTLIRHLQQNLAWRCHEERGPVLQYYINEARNAVDGHEQSNSIGPARQAKV